MSPPPPSGLRARLNWQRAAILQVTQHDYEGGFGDTKDNGSGESYKLEITVHRATSVEYEGTLDHLT
jgi:hypothetical protein